MVARYFITGNPVAGFGIDIFAYVVETQLEIRALTNTLV